MEEELRGSKISFQCMNMEFPLDCIGVILKYSISSSVFLNLLKTCRGVKHYLENEPEITKNIIFKITKRENLPTKPVKYIMKLIIEGKVPRTKVDELNGEEEEIPTKEKKDLKFDITDEEMILYFPNLVSLEMIEQEKVTDRIFSKISNLEKLVLVECPLFGNDGFSYLSNSLKTLVLDHSHHTHRESKFKISGDVFLLTPNLETLEISFFWERIPKYSFLNLKKIKKFRSISTSVSSRVLIVWKDLEVLELKHLSCWNESRFKFAKKLRKLTLDQCRKISESYVKYILPKLEEFKFFHPKTRRGFYIETQLSDDDDEVDIEILKNKKKEVEDGLSIDEILEDGLYLD